MMAPPTVNPARRVLGDVSPNVKVASPAQAVFNGKPMMGSPLKRTFTAMMEGGAGFTYLKQRRLSVEEPVTREDGAAEQTRRKGPNELELDATRFRPLHPLTEGDNGVPSIHEPSPTEPNTPSSSAEDTQGSSAERKSFSSLINYDPSSQTSTTLFRPTRAEILALSLRVAMYKVRTNQINVPFADLRVEGRLAERKLSTSEAVEQAVAHLRREAQETLSRQQQQQRACPKLLPAPMLRPTAYSSRMIYEQRLPSSPPVTRSPMKQVQHTATPQHLTRQLSSPPDSAERFGRREDAELTSSVVKGRVAEGLLGLRNAV